MCVNPNSRLRLKGRAFVRARAAQRIERTNRRASVDPPTPLPETQNSSPNITPSMPLWPVYHLNSRVVPICAQNETCITTPRVNRELLVLALRTAELMRIDRQLQIRMADLRRETTEFIIDVMNNPENAKAKAQMIAAQKRMADQKNQATTEQTQKKDTIATDDCKQSID